MEAADGQIGRDDAVAGDLRGEGVGAEGLAEGAGGVLKTESLKTEHSRAWRAD